MPLFALSSEIRFPPPRLASREGLLAIGGIMVGPWALPRIGLSSPEYAKLFVTLIVGAVELIAGAILLRLGVGVLESTPYTLTESRESLKDAATWLRDPVRR